MVIEALVDVEQVAVVPVGLAILLGFLFDFGKVLLPRLNPGILSRLGHGRRDGRLRHSRLWSGCRRDLVHCSFVVLLGVGVSSMGAVEDEY